MKKIQRLDEFLANQPAVKPATPKTTPTTPTRQAPSPIRRTAPSTAPKPKASAEDVVQHFMDLLQSEGGEIHFDLKKLKKRYEARK
jgi:hypothetical protein